LTGQCEECSKKRLTSQRRSDIQAEPSTVPPIVQEVLRSPGQPLDAHTRAFMEPRFGHDFSRVRVHTDARAAESAWAVDALAYTVGRNVVFGAGQYVPASSAGQQLLAHELTHVVQQNLPGVAERHERLRFVPESDATESEARTTAQSAGNSSRRRRSTSNRSVRSYASIS
jgi:hypothetical protein